MANEIFQFMDKQNAYVLADALFAKLNIRLSERIVKEVSETSSNKQLPSARLLYKLVSAQQATDTEIAGRVDAQVPGITEQTNALAELEAGQPGQDEKLATVESKLGETSTLVDELKHFTIQTVTGAIDTVTEPSGEVFYLQRDNEADKTWMIYIYVGGEWINVGDTEVDLSHIWSKDEIEEMREALNVHEVEPISFDRIAAIIDEQFAATDLGFSGVTSEEPTPVEPTPFTLTKDNRTNIGYTGAEGEVLNIPETFVDPDDGVTYKVTSIGDGAFQNCTGLTSITIPNSVTSIGSSAFWNCTTLNTVNYTGTEEQWNAISIQSGNDPITNATKVYNYVPAE